MVKSIVIPHDPSRSPRLKHLATADEFQEAVDGWLEPIEMPAVGVTMYVNEAARRERQPINCRAMALWWLYTADPSQHPIFLGDVVLTCTSDQGEPTALLERIVGDIFEAREFVVQVKSLRQETWSDTFARFENVFDAATWCMVFTGTLRPGAQLRLASRVPAPEGVDETFRGSDATW
ncbi:DUF3846 domain-containing protein [uncultured Microbacterium sp.]|uniref:DUF3846 domain-containing protein n=1 Tax=uncultured Microbacterium sp. TaxID=191216 RepID=UPI0035C9A182